MKVLICGDRKWSNRERFHQVLWWFPITHIVTGGAKGADFMAESYAAVSKIPWQTFEAEWKKYGRAAGPKRNQKMLDEDPDLVIAFHNDIFSSKGTKDMVKRAARAGKDILVATEEKIYWVRVENAPNLVLEEIDIQDVEV